MPATSAGFSPGLPGFTAERFSSEAGVTYQTFFQGDVIWHPFPVIAAAAVDAGNTPTTILRPGLLMAALDDASGLVAYDSDGNDGSQEPIGVLVVEVNMMDYSANAVAARLPPNSVVIGGKLKDAAILNLDYQARSILSARGFTFDTGAWYPPLPWRRVVRKAADYTVVAGDNGTLFVAITGAVTFTLPTIAAGLSFTFLNAVDANMTIASAGSLDDIIFDHDLAADSVAFSTSSHKIAGMVRVAAVNIAASTLKWVVMVMSYPTNTVTGA